MQGNLLANRDAVDRSKTDFYPTPANVTMALLNYLNLPRSTRIWEPACGQGHMCKTMYDMGYTQLIASDLYETGYGASGYDYLTFSAPGCDWIITNPPFSLSEQFIQRSIDHGKPFALLLKSQYWHAASRRKIFESFRPEAVLPLTWRPNFLFTEPKIAGRKNGKPLMEVYWTVWGNKPAKYTIYQPLIKP